MLCTEDTLIEDWQGLESELERLFMIYGYPVDHLNEKSDEEEDVSPMTVEGEAKK